MSADADAVADMTAMLQCDARTARYYLSLTGGVQQAAVGLYFESGAEPPPASFENEAATRPKYTPPTAAADGSPLPEVVPTEQRDAVEAFAARLPVASGDQPVFKDECLFGFDTPEAEGGLFLNLATLYSVGRGFLDLDAAKTGTPFYLHQKWVKVPKAEDDGEAAAAAAGGGGGGDGAHTATAEAPKTVAEHMQKLSAAADKFDVHKTTTIYSVAAKAFLPYPFSGISAHLFNVCETLLAATDKGTEQAVAGLEEEKIESKCVRG
jgi:hypothetical protein